MRKALIGGFALLLTACATNTVQTPQQKCESTGGAWSSASASCQWPAETPKRK
jgi:hypothetical protein